MQDYPLNVFFSEEDEGYIAEYPDLKYCSAFGETREEAIREAEIAKAAWLETAIRRGKPIPSPRNASDVSVSPEIAALGNRRVYTRETERRHARARLWLNQLYLLSWFTTFVLIVLSALFASEGAGTWGGKLLVINWFLLPYYDLSYRANAPRSRRLGVVWIVTISAIVIGLQIVVGWWVYSSIEAEREVVRRGGKICGIPPSVFALAGLMVLPIVQEVVILFLTGIRRILLWIGEQRGV
jgi:predicted RNase H-like HicB family nuclease